MMKKIHILFFLVLIFVICCSDRERLNPLDPQNPDTQGAPERIKIYSNKQTAVLSWRRMDVEDLQKYYIFRSVNDSIFIKYDSVDSDQDVYIDFNLQYDSKYFYSIQAVTTWDKSEISDTIMVVPGPYNFILADFYGQSLIELSYDGEHIIQNIDYVFPTACKNVDNKIFFTDLYKKTFNITQDFDVVASINLNDVPVEMIKNDVNRLVYIATRDENKLLVYNYNGDFVNSINLACEIEFNTEMAYNVFDNSIFITNVNLNQILKYDIQDNSIEMISQDIYMPDDIEVDQNGNCWIASGGGVIKINNNGQIEKILTEFYIYDISIDNRTNQVYYSAANQLTYEIGYIDMENNTVNPIFVNKYERIVIIQQVPEMAGTGLLLVDGWTGKVIRINSNGDEIGNSLYVFSLEDIDIKY